MKFPAFARKIAPFTVALAAMSACATASAREIGALTDAQTPTPIDMWSIVGFTLLAAGGIAKSFAKALAAANAAGCGAVTAGEGAGPG